MILEEFTIEGIKYNGLLIEYGLSLEEMSKFVGKKVKTIISSEGLFMVEGEEFKLNIFDWILKSEDGKKLEMMTAKEYSKILIKK